MSDSLTFKTFTFHKHTLSYKTLISLAQEWNLFAMSLYLLDGIYIEITNIIIEAQIEKKLKLSLDSDCGLLGISTSKFTHNIYAVII